jgi:hypothetical protein
MATAAGVLMLRWEGALGNLAAILSMVVELLLPTGFEKCTAAATGR